MQGMLKPGALALALLIPFSSTLKEITHQAGEATMATTGQDSRTGQTGSSGTTTPTSGISPATTNAAMTGGTPGVSTTPGSTTGTPGTPKTGAGVSSNPTTPYDADISSGMSSGDMARAASTTDTKYTGRSERDSGLGHDARTGEMKEEIRHTGETLKHEARRTAQALKEEARETVRQMANRQKESAAGELGSLAHALRRAADDLEGQSHLPVDRYVRSAADSLERLSESLRQRDVNTMIGRLERYAREQPAVVVGGALAVGFLLARVLWNASSMSTSHERPEVYH